MKKFLHKEKFDLENGQSLEEIEIAYHTYGNLSSSRDNVVWVCHALTANSDVMEWWPGIVGKDCFFDPQRYFIVCANMPGGCYGSTGPESKRPGSDETYGHQFPEISIRDMVAAYELLRQHLGISRIKYGIGGSMGGMQILEWACLWPRLFENIMLIATTAKSSPWVIAFNESQRMAIENDASWYTNVANTGREGLKTARSIALLSYRNAIAYNTSQKDVEGCSQGVFRARSYQRYQGEKLAARFSAITYHRFTVAMDAHDVGRNRGGVVNALRSIRSKALVVGITSDLLFPPEEQEFIARNLSDAKCVMIESHYGHDGFLVESSKISSAMVAHMNEVQNGQSDEVFIQNVDLDLLKT
jgi:homoserine O-acetyltransferase